MTFSGFSFPEGSTTVPYEVNASFDVGQAFFFPLSLQNTDGSAFPFDQHEVEYVVTCGGSQRLSLTQGSGITVSDGVVTFYAGQSPLPKGDYEHDCRIRNIASGTSNQLFTGSVRIS
jgi:hypothetical protein